MRSARRHALARRLLFPLAAATLVWLSIEVLSLALLAATAQGFHPRRSAEERTALLGDDGAALAEANPARLLEGTDVVHPYVGYVRDPERDPRAFWDVQEDGFLVRKDAAPAAEDGLVIGVFGGSVANIMALGAQTALLDELAKSPRFAGRPLRVVSYAMGGFKQPQQLMALAWVLSLGEPLDLVVELDGFNEIVLPLQDSSPDDPYPFYPNRWPRRVAALPDLEAQESLGRLAFLRRLRRGAAHLCSGPVWRWSPTCGLLWGTLDGALEARLGALAERLSTTSREARTFRTHGPEARFADQDALVAALVAHWSRCSRLMRDLAEGEGIPYLHFLQPNQYVEDAKPLSPEEQRRLAPPGHRNERPVRLGYPALREAGRRLAADGIAFHDLTGLFAAEPATMYSDSCCHLNGPGNARLAREIGRRVVAELAGR